jgi:atlastin
MADEAKDDEVPTLTDEAKDDVVLVEHTDASDNDNDKDKDKDNNKDKNNKEEEEVVQKAADVLEPFQIVSIGSEDDAYAFAFHEDKLNEIMSKIPPGWKVAVVSVVGAFRTGKSFLLSWFLRYLHTLGNDTIEDGEDSDKKWYEQVENLGNDGFHWRGGSERNTTGIWMWSQPHFVTRPTATGGKESMAVLLVDSQGMFDNETTMSLTASIFGLSTLLSSYQIYNVDKRIQEDNLQQLALFSEYARLAVGVDQTSDDVKPFQTMEFLVRDWQNFEEEEDYDQMVVRMKEYLDKVIAERDAKDLQET